MSAIADLFIHLLKSALVLAHVLLRPAVRGARLASLRSQVRGSIPISTQFDGPVLGGGTGVLSLGPQCRLGRGAEFDTCIAGRISIGERVRINSGTIIVANSNILIGDDSLIGEYVSIRDANHGTSDSSIMRTQEQIIDRIHIGRDVWIGRGSCILKGVTIGDGAVIGANSVVTRDIPAGSIYAGVPAKQIGWRSRISVRKSAEAGPIENTHAP